MPRRKDPSIPDALLDQLLAGADPKTAFDPGGLLDGLKKALAERALNAEMDHHLSGADGAGNSRNGYGKKTVATETGKFELSVPRDRQSSFDPQLIAKYQRRFPGFDEKIVSMYARGMSNREIVGHLQELYGVEVSPDLISAVTDAVLEEVAVWQARPLEPVYPIVFFDALRVKVHDEGFVRSEPSRRHRFKPDGERRPYRPGRPRRRHEGDPRPLARAERRRQVLAPGHDRDEEQGRRGRAPGHRRRAEGLPRSHPGGLSRGDGPDVHRPSAAPQPRLHRLQGPQTGRRRAEGHLPRARRRGGRSGAGGLRGGEWGRRYAAIGQSWRRAWAEVVPFYAFPKDVRKIVYTTNAIEALNSKLRRAVRARGHFPTDDAALKLLFLVLNRSEKEWKMPSREWAMAKAQFAVLFGERFARAMA